MNMERAVRCPTTEGEKELLSEGKPMRRNLIGPDSFQLDQGECGGPKGVKEEGVGYSYTGKFSLRVDATAHRNLVPVIRYKSFQLTSTCFL